MSVKPPFDPWAVLGVGRDADAAALKAAFRRRARATHPDTGEAGGDPAAFAAVRAAWAVLSDPDRRARFEATGEVGPAAAPAFETRVTQAIVALFDAAIADGTAFRRDIDLIRRMAAQATEKADQRREAIAEARGTIGRLDALAARILAPGIQARGENVLVASVAARIAAIGRAVATAEDEVRALDAAAATLAGYECVTEIAERTLWFAFADGATGGATTGATA
jgi:hypothetical protein